MNHHSVQRALVRMLFDPRFAEGLRSAPASLGLDGETAALLATIDPRALGADPLRRRRTLGTLVEEFRAASTIALDETRSLAFLEGFFSSPEFHRSVEERRPLVLAYGAWLGAACASGRLRCARLADVIELERLQARARREASPVTPCPDARRVRLAPGVLFRRLGGDVLDTIQRVEKLLFELALVPPAALADDGPRLRLPPPRPDLPKLALLVVSLPSGLSLVTLDDELAAVVEAVGEIERPRVEAIARASERGVTRERADRLITELLDDEILAGTEKTR